MGGGINPTYKTGPPINSPSCRWNPTPSNRGNKGPSSVVIGYPPPRFIRNPHIITMDPYPPANSVGSPSNRNDHRRGPDVPIVSCGDPPSVLLKVAGIGLQFVGQITGGRSRVGKSPIPFSVPSFPFIRGAQGREFCISSFSEGKGFTCVHSRSSIPIFCIDRTSVYRNVRIAIRG